MIISIIVQVSCDRCGQCFQVNVDEASTGTSAYNIAKDAIRGSLDYHDTDGKTGASSIQDGQQLCDVCTRECDAMAKGTREAATDA